MSNVRSLCSEKASDWTQMDGDELYDEIGVGYSLGRRTDPRWGPPWIRNVHGWRYCLELETDGLADEED